MITKLEVQERYGTTVTTYETESGAFGRKYRKIGRECGWDSEEVKKILYEEKSVKQLTVGDVIKFLSSMPKDLPFMHSHFEEGIVPVCNIETRFEFDKSQDKYDDEPRNYVVFY